MNAMNQFTAHMLLVEAGFATWDAYDILADADLEPMEGQPPVEVSFLKLLCLVIAFFEDDQDCEREIQRDRTCGLN